MADLKSFYGHSDRMADILERLNVVIGDDQSNQTDMRELLIEARNFFKYEKEDVDDFISAVINNNKNKVPIIPSEDALVSIRQEDEILGI